MLCLRQIRLYPVIVVRLNTGTPKTVKKPKIVTASLQSVGSPLLFFGFSTVLGVLNPVVCNN